jgi:hypothetical protein
MTTAEIKSDPELKIVRVFIERAGDSECLIDQSSRGWRGSENQPL